MGRKEDALLGTGFEERSIFKRRYNPKMKGSISFQPFVPKVAVFFKK